MKILILGADGFVGRHVKTALLPIHEVYGASNRASETEGTHHLDLLNKATIAKVLTSLQPDIIINCAGVVDNSEKAQLNPIMTSNLLEEIVVSGLKLKRIIISGSAAEYGIVRPTDIPVNEDVPLNASSGYGLSKAQETRLALEFKHNQNLPIVIARIFNPIGAGMHPRFLIPSIISQVRAIEEGQGDTIELSGLSPKRDYINIKDVSSAIKAIVEGNPKETIYNIGSGKSTSNGELVEIILKNSKLDTRPRILETSKQDEPLIAIQADITRVREEFGWEPITTIEATIKEIMHVTKQ